MSDDDSTGKVKIALLGQKVPYQKWSLQIESLLLTKGLHYYITAPLPAADAVPPQTPLQVTERSKAFGLIMDHLSWGEQHKIKPIVAARNFDAYTLWALLKQRHEKVSISRNWANWKRLNAAPGITMSDEAGIDAWINGSIAAYDALIASGRQLDEYIACMIMLDNLPDAWDQMRRNITAASNHNDT